VRRLCCSCLALSGASRQLSQRESLCRKRKSPSWRGTKEAISDGDGKQQRDAKAFAALLDAAFCVHLFHHGLDAGEADLGAVGAVPAGEDGICKGKPGFAVLFDEADGNVLRRVGVLSRFEVMLSRMR
jgi:hypothetical protein